MMCNRVATPSPEKAKKVFQQTPPELLDLVKMDTFTAYYHTTAFTMPLLPFIGNDDPLHLTTAMWKFIPDRATLEAYKPYDTSNARAEEIFDKRTYKDHILAKRGLLLLTGFYEGQEQPDKTSQPYYIYPKDGELLTLGCVYSDWYNKEEDRQVKTFSIITTAANELMAEIHNKKKRMPLIVPPEKRDRWLSKDLSRAELEHYFVPFPDGYLQAHKVSRNLYKRGIDSNTPEAQMAI